MARPNLRSAEGLAGVAEGGPSTAGFTAALTCAAPQLASQVERAAAGEPIPPHRLRRLVESVIRYLLRWTTRPTPFGRFAGIAPIAFGTHAAAHWGENHREVTRPDGEFIAEHTIRPEQDLTVLRTVAVVANQLGYCRGDRWVLPRTRADGDRRWDLQLRLTAAVRAVLQAATSPITFADLTTRISGPAPTDRQAAEQLLATLVREGVLLSAVRPPMTVTDPAGHLTRHTTLPDPGDRDTVDLRVDAR